MIRNEYRFTRQLTDAEAALLVLVIGWRHGSSVITNGSGDVVRRVGHPDDLAEFQKELRESRSSGRRKGRAVLVDREMNRQGGTNGN